MTRVQNGSAVSEGAAESEESKNVAQLKKVFSELKDKSGLLCEKLEAMRSEIADGETKDGLSWLEVKNQMLLGYLIDTNHIVYNKLKGKSIASSPSVSRLVEHRTVLERMRPVDQKLKYQVQKMMRIAASGRMEENDPLSFKANPDAFDSDGETGAADAADGEPAARTAKAATNKTAKYVPPRLAPVHYLEDETKEARLERQMEKAKRKALSSSIIEELRDEFCDGPTEVREEYNPHKERLNKKRRERERYEEDNFVRLQVSKKERHENRLKGVSALDDITKFSGPRLG
ncbi:neuroguidin [Galendromus occidentalis]|uniref:Neuroguidin n=1 Tax=Galendromus occidentalis TaxID=34638 RepID=A0AAJ6QVH0_9ACAR|nr:neuroguidin [Galendromus occidentalis]